MPTSRPSRPSRPSGPGERGAGAPGQSLAPELRRAVEHAGYYPELVADVVAVALGGEETRAHLVHQETTFDGEEVRRHVTVVVLTATRLVVAHADDGTDLVEGGPRSHAAAATTEAVPLSQVRSVLLSHVVQRPDRYRGGDPVAELTVTIGWGSVQRLDLEPATCADPQCEADHGYSGSLAGDDVVLRVSAAADGADAVGRALRFAAALSAATGGARSGHPPA
ncbi:DUF5998 family protein [Pseudokineococcus basanitobsidens]|uniref:DUF5998 family protein n=1 Tax=Pseudokineococcus basanitobsidens TaxID=1926649 RepID=A0ABU8RP64_9ACTN